ncbi:MAG TPA: tRNA (N6-threonylcarbamoyladenosine(37)-N6)-methyltransferase TrmO [Cyclobacteriaceae bacterium]|nr:tRNA (N6-threonylcarbamoyladenosine(37)-N6)-methyltransferase TrmO [Cyclobacteriaceae bacterium]
MVKDNDFTLTPIGVIESGLSEVKKAPCQGTMGAPEAWINIHKEVAEGMKDVKVGDKIIVLTWLHLSDRSVLKVYPQDNKNNPLTSVFATRSADRPNPIGLHPVTVLEISGAKIRVAPMEAIDGTPVVDIKPVI